MADRPRPQPAARHPGATRGAITDVQVRPRDLGPLFAKPPLLQGESEADYDEILSRVTQAVAPADPIQAIWVQDVTDLIWEVRRLRRLKASLLMASRKKAADRLITETRDPYQAADEGLSPKNVNAWLRGDGEAMEKLKRGLAGRGLDLDSIMAVALAERLSDIERIERMITAAEVRRDKIFAEIQRRQEALARQLRAIAHDVTDIA
ncbi:hypothetical protein [Microvirga arabica]|uniref:hypothetical protein n=1 Tax=Microvirga arabica TaxID=1128671 RepID=UPI001939BACA|nr:hypothetical protein [Microvirga arabica]MBM1172037.1 hypothetical protein [Microvirga arabica]